MQTQVAAAPSGLDLTPSGVAYARAHQRHQIETKLEATLDLVSALLALLDEEDGDENLEPSLGWNPYGEIDLEGGDVGDEPELVDEDGDGNPDNEDDGTAERDVTDGLENDGIWMGERDDAEYDQPGRIAGGGSGWL
jgi:hypothetical protein